MRGPVSIKALDGSASSTNHIIMKVEGVLARYYIIYLFFLLEFTPRDFIRAVLQRRYYATFNGIYCTVVSTMKKLRGPAQ
jgi:hypothetical protein